jgi:3-methyladenine DNA glycosylase/8-oxoguanine DNA glycosylase
VSLKRRPVAVIPTPPGFVFASTVVSHGWFRLAPFQWSGQSGILRRTETLDGHPRDLEISGVPGAITISGAPASRELRSRMSRMFQLSVDMAEFHVVAGASPRHVWVVESGFGRLLCGSTLFEDVVKIIATTNTTWLQTVRMVEFLVQKCGRRSRAGNAAFPAPADVVRFSESDLQRDCRLGYRARSIHALARGAVEGTLDLQALSNPAQNTAELFAAYKSLPGIGPYGAAHLLAMDGRHDFIAVDSEFRRFVREEYHGGRTVSDATMLRRYAKWGRWKYLAYWSELWRSVADQLQA